MPPAMVDTIQISVAPTAGMSKQPPAKQQSKQQEEEPEPTWFVRPAQIALSPEDGALYVADEGGRRGRARLQRLSRRGQLVYDPTTRDYAERPNDWVIAHVNGIPKLPVRVHPRCLLSCTGTDVDVAVWVAGSLCAGAVPRPGLAEGCAGRRRCPGARSRGRSGGRLVRGAARALR